MLKVYGLGHCSTTQKGIKYLEAKGLTFADSIDIRDKPPAKDLIQAAIKQFDNNPRKIMNTSGGLYRELNLKEKLTNMTLEEVVDLLAENGMLIKRPFITDGLNFSVGARDKHLDSIWLEYFKGE